MSGFSEDSNSLAALARVGVVSPNRTSAVEEEVIQLFDQFRNRLLHYLLAFSLPVADSEDVLQETFLALFQYLRRGKSRENIGGWLFRVAHNLALKHRRDQRDNKNVPEALIEAVNSVVCPALNPEDRLIRSQAHERIAAALQALSEQNRWCLHLRAEGLRYREIAKVLDISLGSVAASLERSVTLIARAVER
jgi:RNA polymerase sigma-70 factor (ECF subfamily)